MTTTAPADITTATPDTPMKPAAARISSPSLWPLMARLHFYAGVLIAPFLIVAAVTGIAYALTPQLDSILYGDKLHASEASGTGNAGSARPIEEQVRAARAAYPQGSLAGVRVPDDKHDTTRVILNVPGLGAEDQRTVFVDPSTATVKGQLTTWYDATPLTTWLDALHRNLHLGAFGRNYSELAASWLWVIVGGGLLMWLGRGRSYRSRRGAGPDGPGGGSGRTRGRRLGRVMLPDLSAARGVRRTRGWHAGTGCWLIVGLFFLSATGLTWSLHAGDRFSSALDALHAHAPELDTTLATATTAAGPASHHGGVTNSTVPEPDPADVATVLATARAAGLSGALQLTAPTAAGTAWTAAEIDNTWPVHKDAVAVDPLTHSVSARNDWADYPVIAQLTKLGIQAHMGVLFGPVNEFLLVALALGLLCVIFWGYRMWWQRRPTRAGRSRPFGPPPARGSWRRLPSASLLLGLALTVALGWTLPVFGWSLAAFLLGDLYLAEIGRQRDAATLEAATAPR
jgi:uncharacterized iron-regulated membrane protein